ncbi:MAG: phospholipase D-like domain-containing protein [Pseudomonadota bacterium]
MKLIANAVNKNFMQSILPSVDDEVDGVLAAIAYGENSNTEEYDFIGNCLSNHYRLDIWMRYDHTVPVSVPLLKRLLRHHKDNIFCKLIPDQLHSKIIWWKGYGAYIGSANLTERAWISNIESGLFLTESDLHRDNLNIELDQFFYELMNIEQSYPLNEEIIKEMESFELQNRTFDKLKKELSGKRNIPIWNGLTSYDKEKMDDRRKESFRREWHETLTELRSIGKRLEEHKPKWIKENISISWQIDQFLHAYYYNKVARLEPVEKCFARNSNDPQGAVTHALKWWENTEDAPSNENETFDISAPLIRNYLAQDKILNVTADQFTQICASTHATLDHLIKIRLSTLGKPELEHLSRNERIPLFANWLFNKKNAKGMSILELLNYVLYGGKHLDLWERLYTASHNSQYTFPHYGINSIAELVGWALPDIEPILPPRNGRTSKALRALGFDVTIY